MLKLQDSRYCTKQKLGQRGKTKSRKQTKTYTYCDQSSQLLIKAEICFREKKEHFKKFKQYSANMLGEEKGHAL